MGTLISLVQLSAIGASLAFLYLSYQLLRKESSLADERGQPIKPRDKVLIEIRKFRNAALVFFIVGVASEFILSNSTTILTLLFKTDLVRVRFSDWAFFPEKAYISAGFVENRINTSSQFILPNQTGDYSVVVAVRKKEANAPLIGDYPVAFGPFPVGNQPPVEQKLSQADLASLGAECVEYVAFGIKNFSNNGDQIKTPFKPSQYANGLKTFNTAYACTQ